MTPEKAMQQQAEAWNVPVVGGERLTMTRLVNALGGPGRGGGTREAATILGVNIRSVQRYLAGENGTAKETRGKNAALMAQKLDVLNSAVYDKVREQVNQQFSGLASVRVAGDAVISSGNPEPRDIELNLELKGTEFDAIISSMLDGDYAAAAAAFDAYFWDGYDFSEGSWGSIDILEIDQGY